jgi:hypothetical protein
MWQLQNRTPFAAERAWVRDRDGAEIWLVAIKASFEIASDSSLKVVPQQPPPLLAPLFVGQPDQPSLRLDGDLPRTKLTTDIVLLGQAHAPGGRSVTELEVGLAVGSLAKVIKVYGDRTWQGRRISRPQPFVSMPIVYERAYGGVDTQSATPAWDLRNPVGQGYALAAENLDGRPLPNFEYPHQPIERWSDRPEPAGFGPLCSHWKQRQQWAGTYDARWQQERLPLLPEDFDDRHYQCAPPDQQTPQFLHGGEPVALRNLTLGGGDMRFTLPRVHIGLETYFFTGPSTRHAPPKLHTVVIEPDLRRVSLVFHSALPCHARVLKLKQTRIWLKQDLRDGALAARVGAEV